MGGRAGVGWGGVGGGGNTDSNETAPPTGCTSFDPYLKLWLVGVFDPVLTGSLTSANKLVYPENSDTGVCIRWSTSGPVSLL